MANKEHLAILEQGVDAWNDWRESNPDVKPDLSEAHLVTSNFNSINLSRSNLTKANLYRSYLIKADLSQANLEEADLRKSYLHSAILHGAYARKAILAQAMFGALDDIPVDLAGIDLQEAKLNWATFYKANLRQARICGGNLRGVDFRNADLTDANLDGADLTFARLIETNLDNASLTGCRIYGLSAWEVSTSNTLQANLIITPPDRPTIRVDNLEVAQFIYLLLNNEKIRGVIDTIARKVVLILGRFTPERKVVLDTIREELRRRDYLPVLFDFDKPATRDITETMRTLAHLSRFIIADISDPSSIPLELQAVVPDLAVPVQPMLLSGQREFSMFIDLRKKYHWVLATHQYTDINDLLTSLGDKVIAPAEKKAKELEKR